MELRILNYFLMVAREENITRAAQMLHITQPTLSRQLAALEEELGVRLFERRSHRIVLTGEGMQLRRRAQEIMQLTAKAKKELSHTDDVLSGELAIGCGELLSIDELAAVMNGFRQRHPLVRYELHSGSADDIKQRIELGTLDLGLLLEPVGIDKYEFIRMNSKEEFGVMVKADSPLAAAGCASPADLAAMPLLMSKRAAVRGELFNWFGEHAQHLDIAVDMDLLYNAAAAVRKGLGAAVCLRLNCTYNGLTFVPLAPRLTLSSVLAWKAGQIMPPLIIEFIRFSRQYIKGMEGHSL